MSILQVENIKKSFDNVEVLKDISFSLNKGEVLSIIGSSGSGKTTLLRCLNFIEFAENGKIIVDDELLVDFSLHDKQNDASLRQKRLNFGLVFQSFNLFPQYSILKNLTLAVELLEGVKKKDKEKILADVRQALDELKNFMDIGEATIEESETEDKLLTLKITSSKEICESSLPDSIYSDTASQHLTNDLCLDCAI